MATHSSTLAWKIPWMEEPGRLQSMGSQRVGHDWVTSLHFSTHFIEKARVFQKCIYYYFINYTKAQTVWIATNCDGNTRHIGKDPDAGKDWRQEEKGTTEDEMAGWHHQLVGHEFEQAPGTGDEQGSLACFSPWGYRESDKTEWLNWTHVGDSGFIPKLGRSPEDENGHPLQYSCLEDPMDRGAWWATVHGVAKSHTWLND